MYTPLEHSFIVIDNSNRQYAIGIHNACSTRKANKDTAKIANSFAKNLELARLNGEGFQWLASQDHPSLATSTHSLAIMATLATLALALCVVSTAAEGPCDILDAAGNPCVAAHSTVRALYAAYDGPLYNVRTSVCVWCVCGVCVCVCVCVAALHEDRNCHCCICALHIHCQIDFWPVSV